MDVYSTFFYDPSNAVKYGATRADSKHRKIALYNPFADDHDNETGGHGTHVAGIIAGKSRISSSSRYNVATEKRVNRREFFPTRVWSSSIRRRTMVRRPFP